MKVRGTRTAVLLLMLLLASLLGSNAGCSGRHGMAPPSGGSGGGGTAGTLTIKGSDTMVILAQSWAEAYMRAHPGAVIQVSGGGSGTGIAALINGTADIATASRAIKDSERRTIAQLRGGEVHETRAALDALAIYVHESNPVRALTIEQLHRIYRGKAHRWRAFGGPDLRIILYSRENNSGTYAYFKEHVLDELDFAAEAQTLPGTAAVINAVSQDPGAIGYGGIGFGRGVRTVPVAEGEGPAVAPTMENATRGTYPLARHLYLYTAGEPTGLAAAFIAWVLSPEGQALVEQVGFYPLPEDAGPIAEAP